MSFGFVSLCLLLGFDCYCLLFVTHYTIMDNSKGHDILQTTSYVAKAVIISSVRWLLIF